jgi:hypothetical protein
MKPRAIVMLACLSGCIAWSHGERLGYDAKAREVLYADIAANVACVRAELSGLVEELPVLEDLVRPMQGRLETAYELAGQGVQRARIAQLYYGTPQDLVIEIGKGKDQLEVIAFAGLASQRATRRGWWRGLPKRLMEGVATFAVEFARVIAVEIPKAIVPWYVWWILGAAGLIALAIALYALYQYLVVRRKDRALDEFWAGVEQLPKEYREIVGKGRPYLQYEHIPRNERHRQQIRESEEVKRARFEQACRRITESKPLPGSKTGPDFLAPTPPEAPAVEDVRAVAVGDGVTADPAKTGETT